MVEQGAIITEPVNMDDWLVFMLPDGYNIRTGTLASGNYPSGTVLGQVTAGDYVQLDPAAADGSEDFAGILTRATDASSSAQPIVFLEDGPSIVVLGNLTWIAGITPQQKEAIVAEMLALGIKTGTAL